MDEVKVITFEDLTPDQVSDLTGVDLPMAEFMLAIARGECAGDVVKLR